MHLDDRAGRNRDVERGRVDRVEIADHDVDVDTQRERVLEAGVGGDDELDAGEHVRRTGRIPAREHQRGHVTRVGWSHDSLRRHYPVQVRGVGDA